ncbi:MAG: flagellar export chaperone FliS [Gammaproteobacteria bacterium]|nr:flagellar export chaperone FliS [Gammaproteobacteria bacterium]MBU1480850.1 flagellar export chaperone FliS [Gammaproteobacteria bacterium]
MNAAAGIKAYSNVGLESGLTAADPLKLILMLYQGALLAIATAKNQMLQGETAAKGASISKAIMIIGEGLRASLNLEAGGEIGHNLASLYDYMNNRLFQANLNNDPAMLDEVSRLLTELQGAWESIRQPNAAPAPVAQQPRPVNKPTALVYGKG